ncbi:hypothetical protein BGX28_000040 [Mortierella sp. GBA30]|nr:hypothetical protein BGX28_000040 [Mortierella sp. GBA30]
MPFSVHYQAHSPIREGEATFPQRGQPYSSRHGSSEEIHEIQPQLLEGEALTGEQAFKIMHPSPIAQREEHYRQSPTLTASQTLAATYGARPESPLYMPYQAYSYQQPLPSPSLMDTYRSSGGFSSPGLGPHNEDRSDYKADPYRSAYSYSANSNTNTNTTSGQLYGSPYQGSVSGSPNPNDDYSSSFESRVSGVSSQQQSNNGHPRYPLRDLAGQDSNQALSASFYEENGCHHKQNKKPATTTSMTTASSEHEGLHSDKETPKITATAARSPSAYRSSTLRKQHLPSQPSKTDSSATKKAKLDEDEENDVILQKLGVLTMDSSNGSRTGGTRSGVTHGSGRSSRKKGQWTDETPAFTFESVTSSGPPVVTKNRIREPFEIQLMADSRDNYLPLRLDKVDMTIWHAVDGTQIADNLNLASAYLLQPRMNQLMSMRMNLDYESAGKESMYDMVYQELVEACTPVDPTNSNAKIPGINITISGRLHVWGLSWIWKPEFVLDVSDLPCPVNARDRTLETPSPSMVHPMPSVTAVMGSEVSHLPQALAMDKPPVHAPVTKGRRRALVRRAAVGETSSVESAPMPTPSA